MTRYALQNLYASVSVTSTPTALTIPSGRIDGFYFTNNGTSDIYVHQQPASEAAPSTTVMGRASKVAAGELFRSNIVVDSSQTVYLYTATTSPTIQVYFVGGLD